MENNDAAISRKIALAVEEPMSFIERADALMGEFFDNYFSGDDSEIVLAYDLKNRHTVVEAKYFAIWDNLEKAFNELNELYAAACDNLN